MLLNYFHISKNFRHLNKNILYFLLHIYQNIIKLYNLKKVFYKSQYKLYINKKNYRCGLRIL